MERRVRPEWLDELPAEDLRAVRSRRDLQRLNAAMGNAAAMAGALRLACGREPPRRIVELGAGDGTFLLAVARRLPQWPPLAAGLLDRQQLLRPDTREALARLGWQAETIQADVFDWFQRPAAGPCDALLANLFLHHFSEAQLTELLQAASRRAPVFAAVEPRRALLPLAGSRLSGFIGCNGVTRHDAPVSVRAGFRARELSALWPRGQGWSLLERRSGWFGHLFVAQCPHSNPSRSSAAAWPG